MRHDQDEHNALRLAWLMVAGWWLSAIWLAIAWLSILLIVTRPAGLRMIAYLPSIISLKPPNDAYHSIITETLARLEDNHATQRPFVSRLLYSLAIGWWLSIGWTALAWGQSLSHRNETRTITMLMRLPAVMTLQRY